MGLIENRNAQFMLLAGFIIAIGLVITTVILNSVIFEGNIAVGGAADTSKNDIINLIQITIDETRSAYINSTGIAGTKTAKIENFSSQTQSFRDNLSTIYALGGEAVNISWNVTDWNNSNNAYFTDNGMANGATNWTVVQNVSSSDITVNVTSGMFYINITSVSGINYWLINFTDPNTQNRIISNSQLAVNVTQPYTISILNGTNATGNYNLTGNSSGRAFIRARDYVLYANITFSTSRVRADITIPVQVPW